MRFPADECPGGRDGYKGHAASNLKIGDAIGKAMLKLMEGGEGAPGL